MPGGQLLFIPYLFLQSCSSGFSQSCLSSFSTSSCSPALSDMQCPVAGSYLCPTLVRLIPGRGNGPRDPASNLKESNQHTTFYQPAEYKNLCTQEKCSEQLLQRGKRKWCLHKPSSEQGNGKLSLGAHSISDYKDLEGKTSASYSQGQLQLVARPP
ncbi:uncharacterized protein LOC122154871 isoform X2 [Tyto alba]|uniref:uncharacterized protein LOC122154871 isoform X2 n=1 Tax=Tyto alba TaxID=56313 RepID=UPI001C6712DA|nr:uncharacterized protein LOC122154871 isoform X2 [Tyto alba]